MKFKNTIINLHEVFDQEWMERVLLLLKKHFTLISSTQIEDYYYGRVSAFKNACHITFDDGEESFYHLVFPLLQKLDIPASVFVSPKAITKGESFWFQRFRVVDKTELKKLILDTPAFARIKNSLNHLPVMILCKCMQVADINRILDELLVDANIIKSVPRNINTEQLLEISRSGLVEIGAHTMNHPILHNESIETACWEISSSINDLSELINKQVKHFAYPNGHFGLDYDEREIRILMQNGIKLSYTTEHRCFSRRFSPYQIPRKEISRGSDLYILAKMILGEKWDSMKKIIRGKNESEFRYQVLDLLETNIKLPRN